MKRRFKPQWKQAAISYALRCFHTSEYRYWSFDYASKVERAQAAMSAYRCALSAAYGKAMDHKRSKVAMQSVQDNAKELASLGEYTLACEKENQ